MSRKREDDVLLRDYLTDSEALGLVVDAVIAGSKPIKKRRLSSIHRLWYVRLGYLFLDNDARF